MGADNPERTRPSPARTSEDRWAEIYRECHPPKSFGQKSLEVGGKLGGAVVGMAIGAVAGAVGTENPIGIAVVGWMGAYDGWVVASDLISLHDQNQIHECIATRPNS